MHGNNQKKNVNSSHSFSKCIQIAYTGKVNKIKSRISFSRLQDIDEYLKITLHYSLVRRSDFCPMVASKPVVSKHLPEANFTFSIGPFHATEKAFLYSRGISHLPVPCTKKGLEEIIYKVKDWPLFHSKIKSRAVKSPVTSVWIPKLWASMC